jgi:hypothetical protein
MTATPLWRLAAFLLVALPVAAQTAYTYIGQITSNSVLIAWGTATGRRGENSIGRDSASMGQARVTLGEQSVSTDQNWIELRNLRPDTSYDYVVQVNEKKIGDGKVRTHAAKATRLAFFVIGDFGVGGSKQKVIADAMWNEFQKRAGTDNPPRFVLTVGDNIYSDLNFGYISTRSGNEDRHWDSKFFSPYREMLRQIPFYPTLGNHDGNASENRDDLTVYLDNFFFPENRPARWYSFSYGGLVDFFALDSTENSTGQHAVPAFGPEGDQSTWLAGALPKSSAPWKIPYFHHPPFNAGPGHGGSYNVLRHWMDMFQKGGVKVAFTGHEHNFQVSDDSDATGHIRYFITGSGGSLRSGNVMPNMGRARIQAWSPQRHFLLVEIEGRSMRVTPLSNEKVVVREASGKELPMPMTITLP